MMIQRKKKSDIDELIQKIDECNAHLAVIQDRLIDFGNAYTTHSVHSSVENVRSYCVSISTTCISLVALIMSMTSVVNIIGLGGMLLILFSLSLILLLLLYILPTRLDKMSKEKLKKIQPSKID